MIQVAAECKPYPFFLNIKCEKDNVKIFSGQSEAKLFPGFDREMSM